ncbi:hypothetical protein [Sulfurovum sp.]|jgi:hypothetical protein|uniref:hypothetical protein n=1 Tax=Sulfurovum sp. TaxID=1969726 RepID=UPI002A35AF06|nr:hypothetical protein [Sulfurovum sp.]MDD2450320.1 hypothetical protein [Sulfurovum sp.]MDY0401881.1 hypothetical protein [Sulfurovum sp.]
MEEEIEEPHILDYPKCYQRAVEDQQLALVEYGLEIVEEDPYEALKLYREAEHLYEEVGYLPGIAIDLSIAIVKSMAKEDMQSAIDLLELIEVEYYRLEVANDLLAHVLLDEQKNSLKEMVLKLRESPNCESRSYLISASELTFDQDS